MVRIIAALTLVAAAALVAALFPTVQTAAIVIGGVSAVIVASTGREERGRPTGRADDGPTQLSEQSVLDAIGEPVLLAVDGRVRASNASARALLGAHIIGEDVRLAIRHPAASERLAADAADGSVELVGLGGGSQRIEMRVATVAPGRRLIHLVDRTTSYAAERARVDFVANASHELRTPLAAIIGFIETLDDAKTGSDPNVRARFLTVMMSEARRMQRLIDELISLSRIEAEKYSLPQTPVQLDAVIERVAEEVHDGDVDARADLRVSVGPGVPAVVGDAQQLAQVIHNLVGNALKYGRRGTPVTVALQREGETLVRLSVSDEGDGIPSVHIPRLTERFYRVDPGRSRALGGTGLGLAIVKHIVERHRGRLDIASVEGRGTTVSVLLPAISPTTIAPVS